MLSLTLELRNHLVMRFNNYLPLTRMVYVRFNGPFSSCNNKQVNQLIHTKTHSDSGGRNPRRAAVEECGVFTGGTKGRNQGKLTENVRWRLESVSKWKLHFQNKKSVTARKVKAVNNLPMSWSWFIQSPSCQHMRIQTETDFVQFVAISHNSKNSDISRNDWIWLLSDGNISLSSTPRVKTCGYLKVASKLSSRTCNFFVRIPLKVNLNPWYLRL